MKKKNQKKINKKLALEEMLVSSYKGYVRLYLTKYLKLLIWNIIGYLTFLFPFPSELSHLFNINNYPIIGLGHKNLERSIDTIQLVFCKD